MDEDELRIVIMASAQTGKGVAERFLMECPVEMKAYWRGKIDTYNEILSVLQPNECTVCY